MFIPLYIGGSFFFPFIFPKIWIFQLIVEIILFFYIILAISDSRYRPKLNLVTYALAILTIILIITSFTGVDAYRSFWGNTERMSGIIAWFHFFAFAVILSGILKTEREWRNFFAVAVVVSVFQFFYVLTQYIIGPISDPVEAVKAIVWLPGSQVGTIGNADLIGSYAIFSAFFALYLWRGSNIDVRHQWIIDVGHRYFWAVAFFLNMGTLFLASSRGALLGFGLGILIYVLIQVWQKPGSRKTLAVIVLIPIALYGVVWSMRDKDFIKKNNQLNRIVNASFKDDTVQQRFTEWGIAWNAFKARPILGWGQNNYVYLHNAYLNPRVYNLRETNFDRAHNAYLDYASMSGIIGLLGYLFLIGALFWTFCPPTGDLPKGEKIRLLPFSSLMVAYAVQSFFVFDSPASFIALFLTIGFAMFIKNSKSEILNSKQILNTKYPARLRYDEVVAGGQIQNTNFSPQTILAISTIYLLFTVFLVWQASVKPAVANYGFVRAFNDQSLSPEESFFLYKEALKSETLGTTEFRSQYISWLSKNIMNFKQENRLEVIDFGISQLEEEIKDHPLVFTYLNLGQIYAFKARGIQNESIKKEFLNKAAAAYDKALELSPKRLEVYVSYLQLSFEMKNYERGIEIMKRAAAAIPNYQLSHWYLGLAYTASGVHDREAVDSLNRAMSMWYVNNGVVLLNGRLKYDLNENSNLKINFAPKNEILGAVNPYIRLKMWPELLLLYLAISAGDPNDIEIHKSLVLVYQNLGLNDKAQEELKIVEELSPK